MSALLAQLKKRRLELDLKQHDMMMRVGMSRQQYQYLESKGNPRLDTLELVAKGLKSELMLIPLEKLHAVRAILEGAELYPQARQQKSMVEEPSLVDDPWKGVFKDDE